MADHVAAVTAICAAAGLSVLSAHSAPANARVVYVTVAPFKADPLYKIGLLYRHMANSARLYGIGFEAMPGKDVTEFRFEALGNSE